MPRLSIPAIALLAAAFLPAPVMAHEPGERINQLIVYGNDTCPPSADGAITVCARKEEAERFRIPAPLRSVESVQNDAWNNRVLAYETVGAAGSLSCSPVGAGGSLGCTQKLVDAAYAEKRGGSDVKFGQLIEAERAKRLLTIDADSAATQSRVEEIERQYDERRLREEAAAEGRAVPDPAPGAAPAEPLAVPPVQ